MNQAKSLKLSPNPSSAAPSPVMGKVNSLGAAAIRINPPASYCTLDSSDMGSPNSVSTVSMLSVDSTQSPSTNGAQSKPAVTRPPKRPRSVQCDPDLLDNLRKEKRHLTEVMASNLAKLNVARTTDEAARDGGPTSTTNTTSPYPRTPDSPLRDASPPTSPLSPTDSNAFMSPFSGNAFPQTPSTRPAFSCRSASHRVLQCQIPKPSPYPSPAVWKLTSPTPGGLEVTRGREALFHAAESSPMGVGKPSLSPTTLPPSPSDPAASHDLRRTALLRALHLRVDSTGDVQGDGDTDALLSCGSSVTPSVSSDRLALEGDSNCSAPCALVDDPDPDPDTLDTHLESPEGKQERSQRRRGSDASCDDQMPNVEPSTPATIADSVADDMEDSCL